MKHVPLPEARYCEDYRRDDELSKDLIQDAINKFGAIDKLYYTPEKKAALIKFADRALLVGDDCEDVGEYMYDYEFTEKISSFAGIKNPKDTCGNTYFENVFNRMINEYGVPNEMMTDQHRIIGFYNNAAVFCGAQGEYNTVVALQKYEIES